MHFPNKGLGGVMECTVVPEPAFLHYSNHIVCKNAFNGLVSIEKVELPEKYDLVDDVPDTSVFDGIGVDGVVADARVNSKVVSEKLEVTQGVVINTEKRNKVLGSIEMLVD